MKRRIGIFGILVVAAMIALLALPRPAPAQNSLSRNEWIGRALREMETIQPGMKREALDKVFVPSGEVSTPAQGHYNYKDCPYFRVDIDFTVANGADGKPVADPGDAIAKVSRPHLEWPVIG